MHDGNEQWLRWMMGNFEQQFSTTLSVIKFSETNCVKEELGI